MQLPLQMIAATGPWGVIQQEATADWTWKALSSTWKTNFENENQGGGKEGKKGKGKGKRAAQRLRLAKKYASSNVERERREPFPFLYFEQRKFFVNGITQCHIIDIAQNLKPGRLLSGQGVPSSVCRTAVDPRKLSMDDVLHYFLAVLKLRL